MSEVPRVFLYRFLPPDVRDFFLERGWEDLELIQERYGLAPQALDTLDEIQQEILFGYEPIDKVENLIRTRLKYDEVLTRRVAMDFIEMRFLPLDAYLNSAPFRLYAALGGNTTVLRIPKVGNGGITATRVRARQEAFLEEVRQERIRQMKEGGEGGTSSPEDSHVAEAMEDEMGNENGEMRNESLEENSEGNDLEVATQEEMREVNQGVDREEDVTHHEEGNKEEAKEVIIVEEEEGDENAEMRDDTASRERRNGNENAVEEKEMEGERTEKSTEEQPPVEHVSENREGEVVDQKTDDDSLLHTAAEHVKALPMVEGEMAMQTTPVPNPLEALVAREVAEADVLTALKQGTGTVGVAEHPGVQRVRDACAIPALAPDREKRLRVLIGSRLSGVRKQEALLGALMKAPDQGGMGFESALAMRIGSLVADEVLGHHKASLEKTQAEKKSFVEARQAVWHSPTPEATEDKPPIFNPPKLSAKEDSHLSPPISHPSPRAVSVKVPMTDIQSPPRKLAGPVEELGAMTLVDFRRMPGGLAGAIRSVEDQIRRLSASDPALSLRASEAWMHSPMVLEYRRLLSAALQAGVPLEQILRDAVKNPQGFSLEEMNGLRTFHAALRAQGG